MAGFWVAADCRFCSPGTRADCAQLAAVRASQSRQVQTFLCDRLSRRLAAFKRRASGGRGHQCRTKGYGDAYAKRAPAVPKEDMYEQLAGLGEQIHGNAVSEFNQIAVDNARKSAEFMTRNATQPGVVQLPSGIQYSVIKKGDGTVSPDDHSIVTINYRAMLIDGTEFDNTWAHGRPVSFTVGSVISGWRYVIPRMHVGDRWKVVVPPILAFGEQGLLPRIGPNQALVFDLELLDVKPPNPQMVAPQPDITK